MSSNCSSGSIHGAAEKGDLKKIKRLIEKKHVDVNTLDKYHREPI